MASFIDLMHSFEPTGFIDYHFGEGLGAGHVFFKASAVGADSQFDLMAMNTFGEDITGSLAPEQLQRAHEAVVASQSNRS